jgi:hypothetical protein
MKVRLWCDSGLVGSKREDTIEVTDDEVEGMGGCEVEEYLDQCALDFMNNHVDFGFEVLDG